MQPLNGPPRSGFTVQQVTDALQARSAVTVTRGLEVLDLDLNVVADISDDFQAGTVSRDCTALIHGTCSLLVAATAQIDLGRNFLRPYMTVIDEVYGQVRFNSGVFQMVSPDSVYGDSVPSNQMAGSDRLAQLDREIGRSYEVLVSTTYRTALLAVFALAGIPAAHVRLDGTAIFGTLPTAMVYPLLADTGDTNALPVDAVADSGGATTFLRVINALLGQINYRGVWVDQDGIFHCDPYIAPAVRAPEFTFNFDDPYLSMVAPARTRTFDVTSVPNVWEFIQSNLTDSAGKPIEPDVGAGLYTVVNFNDGPTSIEQRGGGAITAGQWAGIGVRLVTFQIDAADQATLEALGDKQVAADRAQAATFALSLAPFPAAWHEDVYLYNDTEMGAVNLKLLSTGWTLDFGSSKDPVADMTQSLVQAA